MKEIRIIIAGSREFNDYSLLCKHMSTIIADREFTECSNISIISGAARGADTLGEKYAKDKYLNLQKMPANWNEYGKRAGYIRNEKMAKYASEDDSIGMLVAFWNGKSRGTKHMIDLANKYNLEVHIVKF